MKNKKRHTDKTPSEVREYLIVGFFFTLIVLGLLVSFVYNFTQPL